MIMDRQLRNAGLVTGKPQTLKPIRLTDQVSNAIREQIFSGVLHPGDRIVEQKIARELGVGQNAVREALIELAHNGFVRRNSNRGTYVTRLSREDAEKIGRVRGTLEGLVIDLIYERRKVGPLDLQEAERLIARMRKSVKSADMIAFYEADIQFHRGLWALAGNEYLSQLLEIIVIPLFAFFILLNLHPKGRTEWYLEAVARHENIVKALKLSSPEHAQVKLRELLGL
jgi:DNA-binding GntR family transcriptional regulator